MHTFGNPRPGAWFLYGGLTIAGPLSTIALLSDERVRMLAFNTATISGSVAILSLLVGAPVALLLARTDLPVRRPAGVCLGMMLFVPLHLHAAAWQAALGVQGWLSVWLGSPSLLSGPAAVVWIHSWAALPWAVLIVAIGLRCVEPELEEEALLDGSPLQVFCRVTLRRSGGALAAAALFVAVTTAGEMTVTNLYQVRTYAEELYTQQALGEEPGSRWQSIRGILTTAWLIVAGLAACSQVVSVWHAGQQAPRVFLLGRWRWPLAAGVGMLLLLSAGAPLASLICKAGVVIAHGPDSADWQRYWSAGKCLRMIAGSPGRFSREFGWSLAIALLAAVLAVGAATLLAWPARLGGWRSGLAFTCAGVAFALPGPVLGLGLIWLFNHPALPVLHGLYDRSIIPASLAQAVRGLPLATFMLWHAFRTIPGELLQAAASEGAGGGTAFARIVLPARWHALAAAGLAAFAIALGELSATILVVPPGVNTLAIQIFGLIHYGVDDQVAGICLCLLAGFAAVAGLTLGLLRAWRQPSGR